MDVTHMDTAAWPQSERPAPVQMYRAPDVTRVLEA
jgi:hypothetical protein